MHLIDQDRDYIVISDVNYHRVGTEGKFTGDGDSESFLEDEPFAVKQTRNSGKNLMFLTSGLHGLPSGL